MSRRNQVARPILDADRAPASDCPWELVWGQPYIDSESLAAAIERDLQQNSDPDFRSRLLVRDAVQALQSYWGKKRFRRWLGACPVGDRIGTILKEDLGKPGFHRIRSRLVAALGKEQVEQVLDLLGQRIYDRVEVYIAGSVPTLLQGLTYRPTDDIDFVNEVPAEIRNQRAVLNRIEAKYGLTLGHVQSHYLPANWMNRRKFLGDFGGIRAYLVDVYDVFVSKLASKQEKHQDDLRVMAPKLDKEKMKQRLLTDGKAFLENSFDRPTIEANWQFIYREPLFPEASGKEGKTPEIEVHPERARTKKGQRKKR